MRQKCISDEEICEVVIKIPGRPLPDVKSNIYNPKSGSRSNILRDILEGSPLRK